MFRLLFALAVMAPNTPATEPLRFVESIPMPKVEGRIDHLAIDLKGQRLFVAALGNNTLEVLDLAGKKLLHSITGLHEPQGIYYLADLNRIYVAGGEDGTCKMFDGASYALRKTSQLGSDADNVRYDAGAKLIYVGYGDGALAAIDPET